MQAMLQKKLKSKLAKEMKLDAPKENMTSMFAARAIHSDLTNKILKPVINFSTNRIYEVEREKYDQNLYKQFLNPPRLNKFHY
jgi:hypothetical protein